MNRNIYLLVAGCTGVGKTTLANLLNTKFNSKLFLDPYQENPYIKDAYNDFKKWTFHSQLFFLIKFAKLHNKIDRELLNIIQERSIYECYNIFVKLFCLKGIISPRDFQLYEEIYNFLIKTIYRKPDLILYLKASSNTILNRIHKRNRDFEKSITVDFIEQQNELYEEWLKNEKKLKVIEIDTEKLNIIENQSDFETIINMIKAKI